MSVPDRDVTLDGDELEEIKDTGKKMVIQRYINGELTELVIQART